MFTKGSVALLIMLVALAGCINNLAKTSQNNSVPNNGEGITVLCDASTGPGVTAGIVVTNLRSGVVQPAIIDPNSTTAMVCGKVNTTAQAAGFMTDYSDPNQTGLEIYGPPAAIQIKCKEITLELQTFQPPPQGDGPITDCPQ